MSIPNYQSTVAALAAQYPAEWRAAHTGGPQTEAFIRRLAWVLHQQDPRVGLNGKRGNPVDISDDALCYDGVSEKGDTDPTRGGAPVTVIDCIVAAGGPNPQPAWGAVGPATPQPHAAWVQPQPVGGEVPGPSPTPPAPTPPPDCRYQPVDPQIMAKLDFLIGRLDEIEDNMDADREATRLEIADVRAALANGLAIEATGTGLRWVGSQSITGTAKG